jgi:hypothetical protein
VGTLPNRTEFNSATQAAREALTELAGKVDAVAADVKTLLSRPAGSGGLTATQAEQLKDVAEALGKAGAALAAPFLA